MSSQSKKVYFNEPQRMANYIMANQEYHVWGRRTGKSHGLTGKRSLDNVLEMPRSMGAFIFPTHRMGLSQIFPNIELAWNFFGYKEDVHYLINKTPPKKWGWDEPFIKPRDSSHVIYWFNGSIIMLISQDRPGTSNSMGIDWEIGDESKFLSYEKLETESFPALSGSIKTIQLYKDNPRFKSRLFCTDMPVIKKSQWILQMEKEMDPDLIKLILHYRYKMAKSNSDRYRNFYFNQIQKLRADALFYSEASTLDNIQIVGEKYIRDQKRTLTPFKYRTQILNIKPNRIENGFYHAYNPSKHDLPVMIDNLLLDNYSYDLKRINENNDCRFDKDIDNSKPLVIAEDHNADINSLVICQPKYDTKEIWFLKSMYVKMPEMFADLCRKFVKYYTPLKNKDVIYYFDSTSIKRSDLTTKTNADELIDILKKAGFKVIPKYLGNPQYHDVKYDEWGRSFNGESGLFPQYNKYNCHDLLVAMQQTGIKFSHTRSGWSKDKSEEHKYFDTEEEQPHLTDAMDTAKRGCEEMPIYSNIYTPSGNIYGN